MPYRDPAQRKKYFKKYNSEEDRQRKVKHANLKKMYDISLDDFEKMYALQNGVCAICKKPETVKRLGVTRALCVDHNHATSKNRQLLCSFCNAAVGYVYDDPLIAQAL